MSRILMLLQLTLIGCRDAAQTEDLERAIGEFTLAEAIWSVIDDDCDRQVEKLISDVSTYSSHNSEVMTSRGETYKGILETVRVEGLETAPLKELTDFRGVFSALKVGLQKVQASLQQPDLRRCSIETEHIHNLPSLIETSREKSFDYYLGKERKRYLVQLERYYGKSVSDESEEQFRESWNLMMA